MSAIPELRTERLLLRGFRDEDLDAWAPIAADPLAMEWVGHPEGLDRAEAWRNMALITGHWALRGYGFWAVFRHDSGELVGRIGLWQPEGWPALELGWLVARPFWGNGYAPEAGRASMAWAREELGADHLISLIDDHNHRSQRVAEKLGMKLEGRATIPGGWELRVYGTDL
jgi:RimJ/RimL family protein N-acetyltransferase